MPKKTFAWNLLFFLLLFGSATAVQAQEAINSDTAYKEAYRLAGKGDYNGTKKYCYAILQKKDSYYYRALVLLGRVYSWGNQYDSARFALNEVVSKQPHNEDALNALANVELWSDHPDQAIMYCDTGLKINPKAEGFYLKKAKALEKKNEYKSAIEVLQQLFLVNPQQDEGLKLYAELKQKMLVNRIGILYDHDVITTPWNFVSVYLARRTKLGTVLGSVNYADWAGASGLQYEADMYSKLTKKIRGYFTTAYSNDSIFPSFKLGSSLYYSLPYKSEIELGVRYLNYTTQKPILIYTGSLSKYVNRFWFSIKPYFIPKPAGIAQSYYLSMRYYFSKNQNDYVTLTLNSGSYPYNYSDISLGSYSLQSNGARLDLHSLIWKKNILKISAAIGQREYPASTFKNHVFFAIGWERLF